MGQICRKVDVLLLDCPLNRFYLLYRVSGDFRLQCWFHVGAGGTHGGDQRQLSGAGACVMVKEAQLK
jgi:hypothetical protein